MDKMQSSKTMDVTKNVNPHFKEVWKASKPYNILKGGRNSFKSSVIALLVSLMIPYLKRNSKAKVFLNDRY